MKKVTLLIVAILCLAKISSAQEEAIYLHNPFNPTYYNPGAAGFNVAEHNLFMNVRSAWTAFPNTPKTYAISYNGAFGKQFGLGAMLFSENIAAITRTRLNLSYAYRIELKKMTLSAGFSTDFHRFRVINDPNENHFYQENDAIIEEAVNGKRFFDVTLGFYASFGENGFAGLTIPSLIRAGLDQIDGGGTENGLSIQHFTINVGNAFYLSDYKVKLEPSILIKSIRNVPFQADFNLIGYFLNEQLITGMTYRAGTGGNLGLYLGTKYKSVRFIYSYDMYFKQFQQYNGGSHEVTVNLKFDRKKGKYDRAKKYRKR